MNKRKRRRNHTEPEWYNAYGGRQRLTRRLGLLKTDNRNISETCEHNINSKEDDSRLDRNKTHNRIHVENHPVTPVSNLLSSDCPPTPTLLPPCVLNSDIRSPEEEITKGNLCNTEIVEKEIQQSSTDYPLDEPLQRFQNVTNENNSNSSLIEGNFPSRNNDDIQYYSTQTSHVEEDDENIFEYSPNKSAIELPTVLDESLVERKISFITSMESIISIFSTSGNIKLTSKGYDFIRSIVKTIRPDISMLTYKSVYNTIWPHLSKYCIVPSLLVKLKSKFEILEEGSSFPAMETSRLVLPSNWAKIDVSTYFYYKQLISVPEKNDGPSIDYSPIYYDRSKYTILHNHLPVLHNSTIYLSRPTDIVRFPIGTLPSSLNVSDWNVFPESDAELQERENGYNYVQGILGPIWMVNERLNSDDQTGDILTTQVVNSILPKEEKMLKIIGNGVSTVTKEVINSSTDVLIQVQDGQETLAVPGDICAFIRPCSSLKPSETKPDICLFVAHHKQRDIASNERETIIWISQITDEEVILHGSSAVTGFPELKEKSQSPRKEPCDTCSERYGTLSDGTRFLKYPILLYHDDFNPSSTLYPQGSVGGCYLVPLGLSTATRASVNSARIITLTPSGCSTVSALRFIINDLVTSSTKGIDGTDPFGNPIKIFLDVVGFVADYPASSPVLDVKSHTADAPCHACSFRRRKNGYGSDFSYTATINSRRLGYVRTAKRSSIIRKTGISDPEAQSLGMKIGDENVLHNSPFFELHQKLRNYSSGRPMTNEGLHVTSAVFDPYCAVAVAPDHALMGICRSVLEIYFISLSKNDVRKQVNNLLSSNLSTNGLPCQQSIYNESGKRINSMTMTSVFCVLLVLSPVCHIFLSDSTRNDIIIRIIIDIQSIVSKLYWWPREDVDGVIAFGRSEYEVYGSELLPILRSLTGNIHSLCIEDKEMGRKIDKPNVHRVVELIFHSIPLFGHVRIFSEMPLETVHQVLKSALKGNTHTQKHITAMFHALCSDWQKRVLLCYNGILDTKDRQEMFILLRNLAVLFIGEEAWKLDITSISHKNIFKMLFKNLKNVFQDPLRSHLFDMSAVVSSVPDSKRIWVGKGKFKNNMDAHLIAGVQILRSITRDEDYRDIMKYDHAIYSDDCRLGFKRRSYPFHRVKQGNVIQCFFPNVENMRRNLFPSTQNDYLKSREPSIFAVCGLIGNDEGRKACIWAVVLIMDCKSISRKQYYIRSSSSHNVRIIRLTDKVRRVGVIHRCNDSCQISTKGQKVIHNGSIFTEGDIHFILRRCDGYPPRMS